MLPGQNRTLHAVQRDAACCWRGMGRACRAWDPRRADRDRTPGPAKAADISSEPRRVVLRQIASLSSFAARNATLRLALIWTASPVAGLRPIRAGRSFNSMMPKPPILTRSPAFR